ncbi:unnamed protein product [Rhizoctonia solani]|uniref:Uncharacterized protein n=1 Tax=Rhizoctonia solani TaxID=456999 RepID=A0A8H2XJU2_9AGAM|nr:unnamed protein product [Rhizoctonia solani]
MASPVPGSSGSPTRLYALNEALVALNQAKEKLDAVSNVSGDQPPNREEKDAAQRLASKIGESVRAWKGPKRGAPATTTNSIKPIKRTKKDQENPGEEDHSGKLVGSDGFRQDMQDTLADKQPEIKEWYSTITMGDPGTIFDLASCGLYVVAAGIAECNSREMTSALATVLAVDVLKLDVLKSVKHARIADLDSDELYEFYEAAHNHDHALHRRTQIELLQHCTLGVHALQSAISWSKVEKGTKYKDGRATVVQQWYQKKCLAQGKEVDFNSAEFTTYANGVKDYNSGANRFLLAYKQLGSILLLSPDLNIHRFIKSSLGPKLKKAIAELVEDDKEGKLKRREPMHRRVLFKVIQILDDDEDPMLIAAIKDINKTLGLDQPEQSSG